jgi:hypothetical protein
VFDRCERRSAYPWLPGPLPEVLKCGRALIVRCATLNSPPRAAPLLWRTMGPLGVPRRGTPKWKSRFVSTSTSTLGRLFQQDKR